MEMVGYFTPGRPWLYDVSRPRDDFVAVTVTGRVKALKAVAYDYGTTRAGAAVAEVK
jgi:hypothetical protein